MDGYKLGQTPPGLEDDGSFETSIGVRAYSIVDDEGNVLVVDPETKCLVLEDEEDEI